MPFEGNPLRTDTKTPRKICRWQVDWGWPGASIMESLKSSFPIAVAIGVFPTEPTNKVAIVKVESK
jgi:hypothetical protein